MPIKDPKHRLIQVHVSLPTPAMQWAEQIGKRERRTTPEVLRNIILDRFEEDQPQAKANGADKHQAKRV